MKFRLHPLYKRFLLLAIVIGPFAWLVFSEDGQWRTDTVLISLLGRIDLNLALAPLYPALSAEEVRAQFPDLELECTDAENAFGDRICAAPIGAFNAIPSQGLVLYYDGPRLAAVKIAYRRGYHRRMLRWLDRHLGESHSLPATRFEAAETHSWRAEQGLVVARAGELAREDEPAVLWLAEGVVPERHAD